MSGNDDSLAKLTQPVDSGSTALRLTKPIPLGSVIVSAGSDRAEWAVVVQCAADPQPTAVLKWALRRRHPAGADVAVGTGARS